jgi:hypothetical protein
MIVGRLISTGFPVMLKYSSNKKTDTLTKMRINQPQPDINMTLPQKNNPHKQVRPDKSWNTSPCQPTCQGKFQWPLLVSHKLQYLQHLHRIEIKTDQMLFM